MADPTPIARKALDRPVFRPVTTENWTDFETLFEGRGGPKTCWCMIWRNGPDGKPPGPDRSDRKAAMAALVQRGTSIVILAYLAGVPVAWCSIAPRVSYSTGLAQARPGDTEQNLWSLVCFFMASPYRKTGLFAALLAEAEAEARRRGAAVLEAYPVAPGSPSYRFSGFVPNFAAAGFVHVGQEGTRRNIMRKSLE